MQCSGINNKSNAILIIGPMMGLELNDFCSRAPAGTRLIFAKQISCVLGLELLYVVCVTASVSVRVRLAQG